jgi:hypothetical protein
MFHPIDLDIAGIGVRILGNAEIENYFLHFRAPVREVDVELIFVDRLERFGERSTFFLNSSIGRVGFSKNQREVQSKDGSRLRARYSRDRVVAEFEIGHSIWIAVNFIHSAVGERLEKRGFVRLHAAGFLTSEGAQVLVAPQGAGKSTLASRSSVPIFSDEIVYLKDGVVFAYPIPIATALSPGASRRTASPRTTPRPNVAEWSITAMGKTKFLSQVESPASPAKLAELVLVYRRSKLVAVAELIFGRGLPQMWPYLLRRTNIVYFPCVAWRRTAFFVGCYLRRTVRFETIGQFRNRA